MAEEPASDPLTAFISRSLRAEVRDVREEVLPGTAERSRVTFTQGGTSRSLIVKRVPKDRSLEAMLLPHLARKTDRVPIVYARGLPPAAVAGRPWLLLEDLPDGSTASDLDAILDAKHAVERAVATDAPALLALGVPRVERRGALAEWPEVLVHGTLVRANAMLADRGVVLTEWGNASLGAGLVDVVRLARDAGVPARALAERYAAVAGRVLSDAALEAAGEAVLGRAARGG